MRQLWIRGTPTFAVDGADLWLGPRHTQPRPFWGGQVNIAIGLVLLGSGVGLLVLAIPRAGEDIRPFLRGDFMQVAYPSTCLALMAFGSAIVVAWLLGVV